eukprot:TRINITY_DN65_c0_g1_i7.p1 TRINITY_DN65_c0_g1~~TRINITY_DN65_c0_g1_i7.p1  ORF type:complete len:134 (-),score=14.85 TRINITY_DN65_c0_g1_i7:232-633(-)
MPSSTAPFPSANAKQRLLQAKLPNEQTNNEEELIAPPGDIPGSSASCVPPGCLASQATAFHFCFLHEYWENIIGDVILAGQTQGYELLLFMLAILILLLSFLSNKCVTGLEWPASLRRPLNCPRCFLDKPRPR